MAVLAVGTGMLLAALYVRYRDVQPIWEVTTQILFYASPILYVATMVPADYQHLYMLSPIAAILIAGAPRGGRSRRPRRPRR